MIIRSMFTLIQEFSRATSLWTLSLGLICLLGPLFFSKASVGSENETDQKSTETVCGDIDAIVALVQRRYDGIEDLSAQFEQTSRCVVLAGSPNLGPAKSLGEVVLAKPGRMRWSYSEPDPSVVVSNGEVLWVYDVTGHQVTRVPVDQGYLSGAALHFLLGGGELSESFEISSLGCEADGVQLELKPLSPSSYERLSMTVDTASGLVTATAIDDLFGNRTWVRFKALKVNQSPKSEIFEFTVPKGVEVIDLSGPS